MEFVAGLALFLLLLAILGRIADWMDSRERRDARQRNQARPWR